MTAIETAARLIASNTAFMATAEIKSKATFYTRAAKARPQYADSASVFSLAAKIRDAEYPGNH